ncbi:CvpA family protein [Pseudomaricurvus alkylphenolicus]|jgi:uncharacterized membrane protein required for colicin V production|uniref:CvpA family protein n=1 Tax=Pseudomaricurvus alkylphenolicus TaxID=1306991 RepID=UPI001421A5C6|nr:CvpA family protein [Pseudomaricurvus alkylphenolicus]
MDIANTVILICIAFFAWRGYRAGALKACGQILALIAGYAGSLRFTESVAQTLEAQIQSPAIRYLTVAVGLFVAASLAVKLLVYLMAKPLPEGFVKVPIVRWGGASVGAVAGFVIALLVLWFYGILTAALQQMPSTGIYAQLRENNPPPDSDSIGQKLVDRASHMVVHQIVQLSDDTSPSGTAMAQLMTQPAETLQTFQRLSQSSPLKALLSKPANQQVLLGGDKNAITNLPDFQALREQEDMRSLFPPGQVSDQQLADVMITYLQRGLALRQDPELQALLQDPEVQQQLQSGNPIGLLTHPKTSRLMTALLSTAEPSAAASEQEAPRGERSPPPADVSQEDAMPALPEPATRIYRWVDENGHTHYSDQARPD